MRASIRPVGGCAKDTSSQSLDGSQRFGGFSGRRFLSESDLHLLRQIRRVVEPALDRAREVLTDRSAPPQDTHQDALDSHQLRSNEIGVGVRVHALLHYIAGRPL